MDINVGTASTNTEWYGARAHTVIVMMAVVVMVVARILVPMIKCISVYNSLI